MPGARGGAPPFDALVVFGVSGDLAHKLIFPALYALTKRGALKVRAAARQIGALAHAGGLRGRPSHLRKTRGNALRRARSIVRPLDPSNRPQPLAVNPTVLLALRTFAHDRWETATFRVLKTAPTGAFEVGERGWRSGQRRSGGLIRRQDASQRGPDKCQIRADCTRAAPLGVGGE
jgi:hypothetical protein